MKRASFQMSVESLARLLFLPDGARITFVELVWLHGEVRVMVEGTNLPCEGEMTAMLYSEEGVTVGATWKPVPPPGPSRFLRVAGTDTCYWCQRPEAEHVEHLCKTGGVTAPDRP